MKQEDCEHCEYNRNGKCWIADESVEEVVLCPRK